MTRSIKTKNSSQRVIQSLPVINLTPHPLRERFGRGDALWFGPHRGGGFALVSTVLFQGH